MFRKLNMMLIDVKNRAVNLINRIIYDENGAADIVAILVIIVILIAVAGIFRQQLIALVNSVFEQVTNFVNET